MSRLSYSLAAALAVLAAVAGILLVAIPQPRARPPVHAGPAGDDLIPGTSADRELLPGDAQAFTVTLREGDFLHLVVDQRGVDVVATLSDPAGRELLQVDTPNGSFGPESLFVVAGQSGQYRLAVRSLDARASGRYAVRIATLRRAGAADRERAAAARAVDGAERLRARGDAAALRAALAAYRAALAGWTATGEAFERLITLRRTGQVAYALSDFRDARSAFEEALVESRRHGDESQEIKLLNDLGAACRRLDDRRVAEAAYERALLLARQRGDRRVEITALNNLGVLYDSQAETQKALDAYSEILAAWRALGDRGGEAATLHNLGTTYSMLGRLAEARDVLERALRLRRALGDRRGVAETLTALAWLRFLAGDLEGALVQADDALRLRREVGDRHGEGATLDRKGTILAHLGRTPEALESYARALQLFRELGEPSNEAHLFGNLGWLWDSRGEARRALAFHQRSRDLFRATGERHGEAFALLGIARAERRLGELDRALPAIEGALQIVEALRGETRSPALRSSFLAVRYDFFELAVDLLMQLHVRDPGRGFAARALEVSERSRARSLLEGIAAARSRAALSPARRERERAVLAALGETELARRELLAAGAPAERLAPVERRLRAQLLATDELRAGRPRPPGEPAVPDPEPLGLEALRGRVLDRDTSLLEIALGDERSYLWLADGERLVTRVLPGRAVLEGLARRAGELLPRSRERGVRQQAALAAAALSRAVLGPVARDLATPRILVVADGALQTVPFAALPMPDGSGRPLLVEHEIVQLPSASVLAFLRSATAARRPAPLPVAVFADPVFGPDDPRLRGALRLPSVTLAAAPLSRGEGELVRSSSAPGTAGLARLPASAQEAAVIRLLVPETFAALGFAANRETVLDGRLSAYRIVHFATHSLLDAEQPELSGLVLSQADADGRRRDGLVRAYEIYGLHLPADLVVLSACRTGVGREVKGEGMMGLTRAFFHAGAARVLVSLWNVDDEATAELMSRFYRGVLRDGLPPSRALRAAQLSMLREPRWESPTSWAAFTLQGEWR